jgi:predicted MFS family arabinose efflux permease
MSERARFAPLHLYHRLRPRRVVRLLLDPEGFRPGTRRFLLSTLVSFIGLGFFGIPLPLLLSQQFGLPSSSVFVFFLLQQVGIALAYPLASRRIRKRGNRSVQMGSLWIRVLLFGSFATYLALARGAPATIVLVIGFVLYGVTWSYFQLSGIALTSRLAKKQNRGLALGLYNAIAGIGWIIAGLGSGLLAEHAGYAITFATACGLLVTSLVVLRFVPDPARERMRSSQAAESGRRWRTASCPRRF